MSILQKPSKWVLLLVKFSDIVIKLHIAISIPVKNFIMTKIMKIIESDF